MYTRVYTSLLRKYGDTYKQVVDEHFGDLVNHKFGTTATSEAVLLYAAGASFNEIKEKLGINEVSVKTCFTEATEALYRNYCEPITQDKSKEDIMLQRVYDTLQTKFGDSCKETVDARFEEFVRNNFDEVKSNAILHYAAGNTIHETLHIYNKFSQNSVIAWFGLAVEAFYTEHCSDAGKVLEEYRSANNLENPKAWRLELIRLRELCGTYSAPIMAKYIKENLL